jgi:hypothetical protein
MYTLKMMWNEAVVTYLDVFSLYLPGMTEETHGKSVRILSPPCVSVQPG